MPDPQVVNIPLVDANEPGAVAVALMVADGDEVAVGDVLCSLETSKSIEDVIAEVSGFVAGLAIELGATVYAGDLLCYLASDPAWTPPTRSSPETADDTVPAGLRVTEPALALARELDVDLASLPVGVLITERRVREAADARAESPKTEYSEFDPASVVVYGAGGHGKTLIELIRAIGNLTPVGVVDDRQAKGSGMLGVPVVGDRSVLADLRSHGLGLAVNGVGGISNPGARIAVAHALSAAGFTLPTLVHPSAVVESSAQLAGGVQILAHAYVGSDATIGPGVIVNTGAVVSHDCVLGANVNLAPGCLLAGGIEVGAGTLLGMSVTTYLGIQIGSDVRVGNGAVLNASVPDERRIRAASVWDGQSDAGV